MTECALNLPPAKARGSSRERPVTERVNSQIQRNLLMPKEQDSNHHLNLNVFTIKLFSCIL
jgi:hypothetical protein